MTRGLLDVVGADRQKQASERPDEHVEAHSLSRGGVAPELADVDENGYGLRVPGLVVSPYAKTNYIDHQQLSHDAYLKFIEDDFLNGQRLNPLTDGRPDPRPDVREESPSLGDLTNDFDFTQIPRPPVVLSPHPSPGPASKEP
jgi:phospholipase C